MFSNARLAAERGLKLSFMAPTTLAAVRNGVITVGITRRSFGTALRPGSDWTCCVTLLMAALIVDGG